MQVCPCSADDDAVEMSALSIACGRRGQMNNLDPLGLARVKLTEMLPEDGAASGVYTRAVESLSQSLARNNAAIIELKGEDAALVRCALESAKLYFRSRSQNAALWNSTNWLKLSGYLAAPSRDMYFYRAGRSLI